MGQPVIGDIETGFPNNPQLSADEIASVALLPKHGNSQGEREGDSTEVIILKGYGADSGPHPHRWHALLPGRALDPYEERISSIALADLGGSEDLELITTTQADTVHDRRSGASPLRHGDRCHQHVRFVVL